ncbi:MAG: hypothetical protein Q9217_000329 [Psora testacea]
MATDKNTTINLNNEQASSFQQLLNQLSTGVTLTKVTKITLVSVDYQDENTGANTSGANKHTLEDRNFDMDVRNHGVDLPGPSNNDMTGPRPAPKTISSGHSTSHGSRSEPDLIPMLEPRPPFVPSAIWGDSTMKQGYPATPIYVHPPPTLPHLLSSEWLRVLYHLQVDRTYHAIPFAVTENGDAARPSTSSRRPIGPLLARPPAGTSSVRLGWLRIECRRQPNGMYRAKPISAHIDDDAACPVLTGPRPSARATYENLVQAEKEESERKKGKRREKVARSAEMEGEESVEEERPLKRKRVVGNHSHHADR